MRHCVHELLARPRQAASWEPGMKATIKKIGDFPFFPVVLVKKLYFAKKQHNLKEL
jgi:hypothetical protein